MKLRRDFHAIADRRRRSISILFTSQAITAGTIARNFNAAWPRVSKHLQVLNESGIVGTNQGGREIYFELKIRKMEEIDRRFKQFRKIWENRFDQLDRVLSNLKRQ